MRALTYEHPWKKPADVFMEKTRPDNDAQVAIAKKPRVMLGHAAEPIIIGMLAERIGLPIRKGRTRRHKFYEWMSASADGEVGTGRPVASAEVKLVSEDVAVKYWRDADGDPVVPLHVLAQATWQAPCLSVGRCYVAALLGDFDFVMWEFEHDQRFWTDITQIAEPFWMNHVMKNVPPPPDATEAWGRMFEKLHPRHRPELRRVAGAGDIIREYRALGEQIKQLEAKRGLVKQELISMVGDLEGVIDGPWKFTWKQSASSGTDWEAVARELARKHGVTPEAMAAEISRHAIPGSRRVHTHEDKKHAPLRAA